MALVWALIIATIGDLRDGFRDDWYNALNRKVIPLARLPWDPCNPRQGQLWFVAWETRPDAQWRRDCSAHTRTTADCSQDAFWGRRFVKGILQSPLGFLKLHLSFPWWSGAGVAPDLACRPGPVLAVAAVGCEAPLRVLCSHFGVFWRLLPLLGSGQPLSYRLFLLLLLSWFTAKNK